MARNERRKRGAPTDDRPTLTTLWHDPRAGAVMMLKQPGSGWEAIAQVKANSERGYWIADPDQKPPRGFLWGDPKPQNYSVGGPYTVYGPIERTCSACRTDFVWPAAAQKQLYEVARAFTDATQNYCLACTRKRNALARARAAYVVAMADAEAAPNAATYLAIARTAVALLDAGGHAPIDRAIGYARKAHRMGAGAKETAALERKLVGFRAKRAE